MRLVWLAAVGCAGCRAILGIEEPITGDAAPIDTAPGLCASWHPQGFDPCALGTPLPALHLTAAEYRYDTSDAGGRLFEILPDRTQRLIAASGLTLAQSDSSTVAVLSLDALTVDPGVAIQIAGLKPLLIVAWSSIAVDGAIDAGSHAAVPILGPGVGGNPICEDGVAGKGGGGVPDSAGGSGGGGGGGAQAQGGAGGAGKSASGGIGGAAVAASLIRAGCPGGNSGTAGDIATGPSTKLTQARGGAGGGALRLVAHDAIAIAGSISAGGAGGEAAPINSACGGGGGGSGGYLGFEAPSVTVSGVVAANGGGGGGGGFSLGAGDPGSDGLSGDQAAPGGAITADGCGQPGGPGSALLQLGGDPGASFVAASCTQMVKTGGGGGGGGAAGYVLINSPDFTAAPAAKLSPPAIGP
jgi:hypothetical protein